MLAALVAAVVTGVSAAAPPRAAVLLIDLRDGPKGATLLEERPDILDAPVAPGSIAKILTLVAALESATITPGSRITCPGRATIAGETYTCTHPRTGRPLSPAEALAHSCNTYFATIAARLPRSALDRVFVRAGLPPPAAGAATVRAALGLEGVRVTPRQLLTSFVSVATGRGFRLEARHRAVLLEGLRGAATYGTARSLGDEGIDALAKTGTAPHGASYVGLVVAALPAGHPARAIVVVAPGAAGLDAAGIAASQLVGTAGLDAAGIAASQLVGAALVAAPDARSRQAQGGRRAEKSGAATGGEAMLRLGRARAGRYEIASVALEDYVAGVVAAEAPPASPEAASKALAIVARTFALANRERHGAEGFDLCDLTHCQAVTTPTASSRAAARATGGLVLRFRGELAQVFHSASCGGHSERPSAVWPGAIDPPYLVSRPEPACRLDSTWTTDVSAAQVTAALRAAGLRGEALRSLRVAARTPSGRVAAVEAGGFDPGVISAESFRLSLGRTAGWHLLKSTAFEIQRRAGGYRFTGHGRGHGVGLCMEGAVRLARQGVGAAAILRHYFPGLDADMPSARGTVEPGTRSSIQVFVPSGEEAAREPIRRMAREALAAVSAAANLPGPASIRLVFHPTVQAYTRATGLPWWTAGASRGESIDLLPPAALRRRGLLERTIRHEIAHAVIGSRLAGRPLWIQEGAAMFLAGELDEVERRGTPDGRANVRCPGDAEITGASSADALKQAYRRAAACFARELRARRRWNEIGEVSTSTR